MFSGLSFFIFTLVLAFCYATRDAYFYALPETKLHLTTSPMLLNVPTGIQAQYHAQDAFGQYSYGYADPLSTKQEVRSADGSTRGTYSYIDANGKLQKVEYTADAGGFRVRATNLPQTPIASPLKPNEETAEVAALRAQHLQAHEQAKLRLKGDTTTILLNLPQTVQDTPEVAAAKIEFFKRYEAEKLRHKMTRERQQYAIKPSTATASSFGFLYELPIATLPRYYLPVA